ncbi:unnamed protein product [Soboliphyme baturini]|uniref:DUF1794 domain-containing protein n=1 Tax=Soboliphyme baturini TaxID=241478 RepID=A0A183IVR1_9BILA|nr:unnamed protein product [Soboliphyme baturini]
MFLYSSFAWGINDKKSLHAEYGFITMKRGTNIIGMTTVMNNGFTTSENGEIRDNKIVFHLHQIGRISWSRDLPVLHLIREITLLEPDVLEQRTMMQTLTHVMQEHTSIRYRKVFP